ncbi:glycosyl hydrolase family 76-domain-containing protein [Lipomyces arxii]|uniref:glycosyl hydrolase family 76-domain-containing protein n=1 Tax=Lipomyces arxii TaxID=56418 RepID=UPI0034CE4ABF
MIFSVHVSRFISLFSFLQLVLWPILLVFAPSKVGAIDIDVNDVDSIKHASWVFAHGLMTYYNGNQTGQTPGMFVGPYYWWEAGGAWGSLLDYWFYTGDETYNDLVSSSLLFQVGNDWNYMPSNQTTSEGNDDQAFWGFTVMAAAERNFTNPPRDQPQWLELAQTVFDSMAQRWDTSTCGGGLRWQIFQFNNGYDYKNTISNAGLFMMAARLARYTENATYIEWAERTWDWTEGVGLLDTENYYFYDGGDTSDNCTEITDLQWTYNAAIFLAGSAYLYNYTESDVWQQRTQNILDGISVFFKSDTGVLFEAACEQSNTCDTDQKSFKAYMGRFLGLTAVLAPFTADTIQTHLTQTAAGVAQSCTGGSDGVTCGTSWIVDGWDNSWGLGQQMSALEVTQNLLVHTVPAPYTAANGGSSPGNSSGRTSRSSVTTTADRAGAGIVTSVILLMMLGATWWMAL